MKCEICAVDDADFAGRLCTTCAEAIRRLVRVASSLPSHTPEPITEAAVHHPIVPMRTAQIATGDSPHDFLDPTDEERRRLLTKFATGH